MKTCKKCGVEKELNKFPLRYGRYKGRGIRESRCNTCRSVVTKVWMQRHAGWINRKNRERCEEDLEYRHRRAAYQRNYKASLSPEEMEAFKLKRRLKYRKLTEYLTPRMAANKS